MAKIVDVRSSGGEFVVLGEALTLPSSSSSSAPLFGSLRFNPVTKRIEQYSYLSGSAGWIGVNGPAFLAIGSGYYHVGNGLIEFWGTTTSLSIGTTSIIATSLAISAILDVSAQCVTSSPVGTFSCLNYTNRGDAAPNKFDIYTQSGGVFTFRGKAQL